MAPTDRKGRDLRTGKREDRMKRATFHWEADRVFGLLEAGASPADITLDRSGPWPSSEYEARHL